MQDYNVCWALVLHDGFFKKHVKYFTDMRVTFDCVDMFRIARAYRNVNYNSKGMNLCNGLGYTKVTNWEKGKLLI